MASNFTFFDSLKIYFKNPIYIIWDIKDFYNKLYKKSIDRKRKKVYEYDCRVLNYDPNIDYKTPIDNSFNPLYWNPVFIVVREIEHLYTIREMYSMHVKNIYSTKNKNEITIHIELKYPSRLIGSGGLLIDELTNRLSYIFGNKTTINIIEYKGK